MKKQIHVVGAVIIDEGLVLCARRGPSGSLAGMWEFPGGKIEVNETPTEALAREIREELDCEVRVGKQVEYTAHDYDFGVVHLTTFYCDLVDGTPTTSEHSEHRWLPPGRLAELEWAPADIPAIESIARNFAS